MFSVRFVRFFYLFVGLFDCQQDYGKLLAGFSRNMVVAWAKEEPIHFGADPNHRANIFNTLR